MDNKIKEVTRKGLNPFLQQQIKDQESRWLTLKKSIVIKKEVKNENDTNNKNWNNL